MRRAVAFAAVLVNVTTVLGQQPAKTIDGGVLDHIELFAPSIDRPHDLAVVVRAFDASMADLGTGAKDGKAARQEEARTMQEEGPKVLAGRLVEALQKDALFKEVRILKSDDSVPPNALVLEGK